MLNRKAECVRKIALCAFSAATLMAISGGSAIAMEWSDTSVGYRYGNKFSEPYVGDGISKNVFNLTHSSGYKYGTNFLNVDLFQSDSKDDNAREVYVVLRHTLDVGKVLGRDLGFGPIRGYGLTAGFDWNTKNDPGYASKKRMWVVGPTVMMDVPGFLNISLLMLWESNHPVGVDSRYHYEPHPALNAVWAIPIAATGLSFEGYLNYIAAKGMNEFGGPTSAELNIDAMVMYDLGMPLHIGKNKLRVGVEYQYWRNKFGNPPSVPGSLAKTPMVRIDFHF